MPMPMAMSVHGLCRLSLSPKITMCIVLLSYALRAKIIYIMLKTNVLDSTNYIQRFTKEFVNTYLVLWRARQSQSPYHFFLSGCGCCKAKFSLGGNVSIFMKRETLQKRHKQSNKHVFRVCVHSYVYSTKVT